MIFLCRSLGQATPCVTAFAEGQAAAYRMFETIKRQPEIDTYDTSGVVLEDMKGDVELQDVYFSYPTRPDHLIFNGFSLKVLRGTTMAIVGESGSGKSTVINLVERFYDPQAGEVLIDGVNIKSLRLGWIREKIGLVSQEPLLFTTTIKENITYGKTNATLEEIKRATELANAANFIDKLPNVRTARRFQHIYASENVSNCVNNTKLVFACVPENTIFMQKQFFLHTCKQGFRQTYVRKYNSCKVVCTILQIL